MADAVTLDGTGGVLATAASLLPLTPVGFSATESKSTVASKRTNVLIVGTIQRGKHTSAHEGEGARGREMQRAARQRDTELSVKGVSFFTVVVVVVAGLGDATEQHSITAYHTLAGEKTQ